MALEKLVVRASSEDSSIVQAGVGLLPGSPPDPEPREASSPRRDSRPSAPLMSRRCPYCHDSLQARSQVLCASCVTPHHEGCFREHGGCSLLGCESKRSLDPTGPASRVMCRKCSQLTPAKAPYCSLCGVYRGFVTPRPPVGRPEPPDRPSRESLLITALLLILTTFAGGAFLGRGQGNLIQAQASALEHARVRVRLAHLRDRLRSVQRAQHAFALYDLDDDAESDFALDFRELEEGMGQIPDDAPLSLHDVKQEFWRHNGFGKDGLVRIVYREDGDRIAVGCLRDHQQQAFACDLEGRITRGSFHELIQ